MKATISMDALYDFLKSLSLGSDNERWLAEKLLDDAEAHEKERCLAPYTVEEINAWIDEAETELEAGECLTAEEANQEVREALPWLK